MTDEEEGQGERGEETYLGNYFAQLCQLLLEAPSRKRELEKAEQKEQAHAIDMPSLSLFPLLYLFPFSSSLSPFFPFSPHFLSSLSVPLSLSLSVALFQVSPFDFNLTLTLTLVSPPLSLSSSPLSLCLPIGLTWQPQLELGKHSAIHPSIYRLYHIASIHSHYLVCLAL